MSLFDDTFEVTDSDADAKLKRFDLVSRIECRAQDREDVKLSLDYNCDIYTLEVGAQFEFVLRSSLSNDPTAVASKDDEYDQSGDPSVADDYEYVMYGKIFKVTNDDKRKNIMSIYASFGGLLMGLTGEASNFDKLSNDQRIYLLIKKIA